MATISEALALAIQHHQGGRLRAAEQIYRQILALRPDHAEALHLLGVVAHQSGKDELAVEYIERAIGLKGNAPAFHSNLGGAYSALGKVSEAVACYRRALELKPDFAEVHLNLGNVWSDQAKLDEAIACYRRALELKPDLAEAHYNLGNALKEQGKLDEAAARYRRALELKPDYAEAYNNLAVVLNEQGRPDDAIACCRRALELKPDYADAHYNLGGALKEQGRLDEAVACCRRALELKPDDVQAHKNLGNAVKEQGKLDEAIACYRRALQLAPDYAEGYNNLGAALKEQGDLDQAIACYGRAIELKPDSAEAHNNLGMALREQGKPDDSLACYRRAIARKPDYAEAHSNLGVALLDMGDLRGAEDFFRAALRHNGRFAFAHYKLAELLGAKLPRQDLDALRRLLEETELTDTQRSSLHFGLAKVLDARGDYEGAARHLEQANALQRPGWRKRGQEYDPKEEQPFITQMIEVCTPDFFARVRGFGLDSELPVFVVGLPRSGTTLVEQILASHSRVFGAGEIRLVRDTMAALGAQRTGCADGLRRLDRPTALRLAARHVDSLRALDGAALRIVDKMPDNYFYLGLLASLFPRAKFIHCRRNLRDVAVSCWMTYFKDIRWANDQQHIASRFHDYQRLMTHWRKVLPVPLLDVDYEETVADPQRVARKLTAFCGLAWEPACLEFQQAKRPVRTASAVQVRQPVFRTSVGRWKHYEQALAGLFARLDSHSPS